MADQDSYIERVNRREVSISRYSTNLINEFTNPNLRQIYLDTRAILLDAEEITSNTKLNKIAAEVARAVRAQTDAMYTELTEEMSDFAVEEAGFSANLLADTSGAVISTPAAKKIQSYVEKAIMSLTSGQTTQAGIWADFVKSSTDSVVKSYDSQIKAGYSNGKTVNQIVKDIKGVTDGLLKNQAESLVRTGVQHYAASAREAMYEDNADIMSGGRTYPSVTFDSRTTTICISVDEKYADNGWLFGKNPGVFPPLHWGCRTILVSVPKGVSLEGTKPAIEGRKGEGAEEAFERKETNAEKRLKKGGSGVVKYSGRKDGAFKAEQIPVKTRFSKFLKDQPDWFQDKVLGKKKAKAFRSGELDLSNLTDSQLSPLTLDELKIE